MTFLQAFQISMWVNDHPPSIAAPVPGPAGWTVVVRVPYFDEVINAERFDRHLVDTYSEARDVIGY